MRSVIMNVVGTLLVTVACCVPFGLAVLVRQWFSWDIAWVKALGVLVFLWLVLAQALCLYILPVALADIWKPLYVPKRLAR